jgi:hypothetical protein
MFGGAAVKLFTMVYWNLNYVVMRYLVIINIPLRLSINLFDGKIYWV